MSRSSDRDLAQWAAHRPRLMSLAYRMLGDVARAEDMVQEAWIRFSGRTDEAIEPGAYLASIVTRLCLNDLGSARARKEESRSDRLPEPIDLDHGGPLGVEAAEEISMALLVTLQRLSPTERAVLLLHDVFDVGHEEIAKLVGKTAPACRKLLERARASIAAEKRLLGASREEHARLLDAFIDAANLGDMAALVHLLAEDATLTTDGGPEGRVTDGVRNLPAPLEGAARIAAFVCATTGRGGATLEREMRELNGRPSLFLRRNGEPFAALMLGVADGRIHRIYFQADAARLKRVAGRS